jgi:hypothetical protein
MGIAPLLNGYIRRAQALLKDSVDMSNCASALLE